MAEFLALNDRAIGALRNPFENEVRRSIQATEDGSLRGGSAADGEASFVEFFDVVALVGDAGGDAAGLDGSDTGRARERRQYDGTEREARGAHGIGI